MLTFDKYAGYKIPTDTKKNNSLGDTDRSNEFAGGEQTEFIGGEEIFFTGVSGTLTEFDVGREGGLMGLWNSEANGGLSPGSPFTIRSAPVSNEAKLLAVTDKLCVRARFRDGSFSAELAYSSDRLVSA